MAHVRGDGQFTGFINSGTRFHCLKSAAGVPAGSSNFSDGSAGKMPAERFIS
jgi:hypothetical protein